jgi:hypothetical protein
MIGSYRSLDPRQETLTLDQETESASTLLDDSIQLDDILCHLVAKRLEKLERLVLPT